MYKYYSDINILDTLYIVNIFLYSVNIEREWYLIGIQKFK